MAAGTELTPLLNVTAGVMRTARLVAVKELRSALRDRQTVLYTVVLPMFLYPVVFWVIAQGITVFRARDAQTEVEVAIAGMGEPYTREREALAEALEPELEPGPVRVTVLGPAPSPEEAYALLSGEASAPANAEASGTADAHGASGTADAHGASGAADAHGASGAPDAIVVFERDGARLFYESTTSRGQLAAERAETRLAALAATLRRERLAAEDMDPDSLAPFEVARVDLADERDVSAFLFSFILPMMFAVMAVMGAFYPAVDCTAGEKERGTMETTLLLPTPRLGVQLGKILAVTVSAFVAVLLNLVGLALTAEALLASLGLDLAVAVPWSTLALSLPVCGAFLFTTSAMMMAVASFSDTFKQGQASLGFVQMLFIFPAVFAIMPGVELTPALALVPVVQTVLAFKTILVGLGPKSGAGAFELALVFASQAGYAALAVWITLRLSTREALQEGSVSLQRAFALWRGAGTPR